MKRLIKLFFLAVVLSALFSFGSLLADKQEAQAHMIRLHIVANSDSEADQNNKLAVRDAVCAFLEENLGSVKTKKQAEEFISGNLDKIEAVVNNALQAIHADYKGSVSFKTEEFGKRVYDTFSLPSGIYRALKIELGQGEGKNWWCVAFPALCVPATSKEFEQLAVETGLQEDVVYAFSGREGYRIRFFLLDCLGNLENLLHFS